MGHLADSDMHQTFALMIVEGLGFGTVTEITGCWPAGLWTQGDCRRALKSLARGDPPAVAVDAAGRWTITDAGRARLEDLGGTEEGDQVLAELFLPDTSR